MRIFSVALLVFLVVGCSSVSKKEFPFHKTIKTLKQYNAKGVLTHLEEYNQQGQLIKNSSYSGSEEPNYVEIFTYNENGDVLLQKGGMDLYEKLFEYDEKGRLVKEIENGKYDTFVFTYNYLGDSMKVTKASSHTQTGYSILNENGYAIKRYDVSENGDTVEWAELKVDDKGNILEEEWVTSDGAGNHYKAEYDSLGNEIKRVTFNSSGALEYTDYTEYNHKFTTTSYRILPDGSEYFRIYYNYNPEKLTLEVETNAGGKDKNFKIRSVEYSFWE
ncbi:MAG: hypothetical protein KDC92_03510 [Bacteroidetes bacterium]|nr:hypothetical protein [Bacteroidota bacterium]